MVGIMNVSRETQLLNEFAGLVRKWNPAINLVAPSTLADVESRHIADGQQLADISGSATGSWLDLGSGGGFPGLVMAVMREDLALTLLESDKRKSAFLKTCIRELGLKNVTVVSERIEEAEPMAAKNISARALASLPKLLGYAHHHLATDGTAWLMKGKNWRTEVEEARKTWQFTLNLHPSATEAGAAILEITDLCHA